MFKSSSKFKKSRRVQVECWILRETEKAILIRQSALEEWIPRSLCHHISKRPGKNHAEIEAVVTMDEWIADDRGLESEVAE